MEIYVISDWLKLVTGLVIYQLRPEPRVLLGVRQKRDAAGDWCLPTGLGAVRRDITAALLKTLTAESSKAHDLLSKLLKDPTPLIQNLPERVQPALKSPAGAALAEARWYVELPADLYSYVKVEALELAGKVDLESALVKIYYALKWPGKELPKPATTGTEWPFKEVRWFNREEIKKVKVAFGCGEDLERIFWPRFEQQK